MMRLGVFGLILAAGGSLGLGSLRAIAPETTAIQIQVPPPRVSGPIPAGLEPPRLIRRVEPVYPTIALAARMEGRVEVEFKVNKEGRVVDPKVVTSPWPPLNDAALAAVRQWEYQPARLKGTPIEVTVQALLDFRLLAGSPRTAGGVPRSILDIPLEALPAGAARPFVMNARDLRSQGKLVEAKDMMFNALKTDTGAMTWLLMGLSWSELVGRESVAPLMATTAMKNSLEKDGLPPGPFRQAAEETIATLQPLLRAQPGATANPTPADDPLRLGGTSWRCRIQLPDAVLTGYIYFHSNHGTKMVEVSRAPADVGGAVWPTAESLRRGYVPIGGDRIEQRDTLNDMEWVSTENFWATRPNELRIMFYFLSSIYVFGLNDGQLEGGLVKVSESDPVNFEKWEVCKGRYRGRSGPCPNLWEWRVTAPVQKTYVCERRPGWLK